MKPRFFLLIAPLVACGGAAFTTGDDDDAEPLALETTPPLAVRDGAPAEDASVDTDALGAPGALAREAAAPEAAPAPEDPDANGCALFAWHPPDGSVQPFGAACMQPDAPTALVPHYYAVLQTNATGCLLEPTPAACQCATDYSCACLIAQHIFCNGTGLVGCDDSSGAPVVTCR